MDITVKKIRTPESIPTKDGFTAQVLINGELIGVAFNSGGGARTKIDFVSENGKMIYDEAERKLFNQAVERGDLTLTPQGLYIEREIERQVIQNSQVREQLAYDTMLHKRMESAILYGEYQGTYKIISFEHPISNYLKDENAKLVFTELSVAHISRHFDRENKILNTNLPKELVNEIINRVENQFHLQRLPAFDKQTIEELSKGIKQRI